MNISDLTFPNPIVVSPKTTAKHSIIWMHGLGANANDFASMPSLLNIDDLAIRFIFPNAPIRPITLNGGMSMPGWYNISSLALRNDDQLGIEHSNQYIQILIQQEINRGIPSQNILLAGFSQGGAMSIYSSTHCPYQLGGVIALSCYLLEIPSNPKSKQLNNSSSTPFFVAHGTQDPIVNYSLGQVIEKELTRQGYPITFETYDIAHEVCQKEIDDISNWLHQHLNISL